MVFWAVAGSFRVLLHSTICILEVVSLSDLSWSRPVDLACLCFAPAQQSFTQYYISDLAYDVG